MDRERWNRVKQLHFAASDLAGEERKRFLVENCASPEERREVEERLGTEAPTGFMDKPVLSGIIERPELRAGDHLGRYEILALLGGGGGGKVYRALDPTLRRQVAIKVLSASPLDDDLSRRRFLREAEAACALNHPSIVTVYEVGSAEGLDYIAMELITGKSLRDSIPKKGLNPAQFFPWAIQIADGLAAAHQAGMVHRDLKPGNVMITDRKTAKLVDFGLAKAVHTLEDGSDGESMTKKGMVMGTCAYMAPEQAEGKRVDSRADIFSLGCVLYEMATGQQAFTGGSQISTLASVIRSEPKPIRGLAPATPKGLEQLVAGCLRKDPSDRWQSALDVRLMLEQLQQDSQAEETARRPGRRTSIAPLAAALGIGALIACGGLLWYKQNAAKHQPEERFTALTMDGGLTTSPSLSGDGRLLAYASDRGGDGNLDIWIQQIGGHSPIRLTSDPADETDPDISLDGTRVAFRSEKDGGGIYVVPALGGDPVLVVQGGRNPRFSPDGQWIAYWTGREGAMLMPGSAQAYVIPTGGGRPRQISESFAAAMNPVWSPNGDKVLVVARRSKEHLAESLPDWWILPVGKGEAVSTGVLPSLMAEPRSLRPPASRAVFVPLTWLADSKGKVVFSALHGDTLNLWSIGVDLGTGRAATKPIRVTNGTSSEMHAAFANLAESSRMVFTTMVLQFDLWEIPLDAAQGRIRGEMSRITDDLAGESYPSLTSDGNKLVFTSKRGPLFALCVRDFPQRRNSTLHTSSSNFLMPTFSGDGNWVSFGQVPGNISRIAARGGTVTQLCEKCGTPTGSSQDGNKILLEPIEVPENIRQLDAGSGSVSVLASAPQRLFGGELSHDGKWLVLLAISENSAVSRIMAARVERDKAVDFKQWIPITDEDATYSSPHWSPDGGVIYFLSDRDGFRCVWARKLDSDTKKPVGPILAVQHFHHARRSLQHVRNFTAAAMGPAISADRAVLVLGDLTGNIWMREQKTR